jgi:hypothetical protein
VRVLSVRFPCSRGCFCYLSTQGDRKICHKIFASPNSQPHEKEYHLVRSRVVVPFRGRPCGPIVPGHCLLTPANQLHFPRFRAFARPSRDSAARPIFRPTFVMPITDTIDPLSTTKATQQSAPEQNAIRHRARSLSLPNRFPPGGDAGSVQAALPR